MDDPLDEPMIDILDKKSQRFKIGFAIALITLVELHGDDGVARDVMVNCGYNIKTFVGLLDDEDYDKLKGIFEQ